MSGKFEVYQDRASKWRWRLKAANGHAVAFGDACESKANAIGSCEAVMRAAAGATIGMEKRVNVIVRPDDKRFREFIQNEIGKVEGR